MHSYEDRGWSYWESGGEPIEILWPVQWRPTTKNAIRSDRTIVCGARQVRDKPKECW